MPSGSGISLQGSVTSAVDGMGMAPELGGSSLFQAPRGSTVGAGAMRHREWESGSAAAQSRQSAYPSDSTHSYSQQTLPGASTGRAGARIEH